MAKSLTRIELHAANQNDYSVLHNAMETIGFSRKIPSNNGQIYHLPTAEYYYDGPSTLQQILEAARTAAAKTNRASSIIVTEAVALVWQGLNHAQ